MFQYFSRVILCGASISITALHCILSRFDAACCVRAVQDPLKRDKMATLCLQVLYTVSIVAGANKMNSTLKGDVIRNICFWANVRPLLPPSAHDISTVCPTFFF